MAIFLIPLLALSCLALASRFLEAGPASAVSNQPITVVAFENVNVLPMDSERVLEGYTVVVRGERIDALGPADDVQIPEDASRVEGAGRFLLPGLAEMHGHIPPSDAPPEYTESVLLLFVANGITTVRGMQGSPGQQTWRDRSHQGEIVGPNLYLAGPGFSGGSIDSPQQAEARVEQQVDEGWDLLKVLPGLTPDEYDAMAKRANQLNIRFAGHVPSDVGLVHAIEMNQETFDHLDGYLEAIGATESALDPAALDDLVHRSREAGVWVVPTMALWEVFMGMAELDHLQSLAGLQYMPPDMVRNWTDSHRSRLSNPELNREQSRRLVASRMQVLRALNEGGVRILMGTDAPQQFSVPGFSLRHELERMSDAGMSPYQILRSGTFNVGQYFRNEDAFGVVLPGMRADLILVEHNPLEDVRHVNDPAGVMVRGRWYSREDLDARLAALAERYR